MVNLNRELGVFLVVGMATVLIDYLSYLGYLALGCHTYVAKGFGFITGTLFAYVANKLWTFEDTLSAQKSVGRFALLYTSTLGTNIGVNALMLMLLPNHALLLHIAFLCSTGVSATLNFIGMKYWVFAPRQLGNLE